MSNHQDSYEPTNWKDGDIITQEKLNKLEYGVKNATLKIGNGLKFNDTDGSLEIGDSINELGNEVNTLAGEVAGNSADIMQLQNDMTDATGQIEQIITVLKEHNIVVGE